MHAEELRDDGGFTLNHLQHDRFQAMNVGLAGKVLGKKNLFCINHHGSTATSNVIHGICPATRTTAPCSRS